MYTTLDLIAELARQLFWAKLLLFGILAVLLFMAGLMIATLGALRDLTRQLSALPPKPPKFKH